MRAVSWIRSNGFGLLAMKDVHADNDLAFRWACGNGHLEIAKWLVSLEVDTHAYNNDAFCLACAFGHLEIAKWLYSMGGVEEHVCAFREACENGHVEIVKWLYALGTVDICDEMTFARVCAKGHFDVRL